ncbi:hypothetical protein EJ04DRAFT_528573 [Polyplosphaeria fusca]|uniref:Uncharacterized protein n=1 Tax=Polyplosphaeria fusca TaxID=682080 RepID=A0A9P4QJL9_9PLEO|nr:hypothetical protein EJ04DRAFT_528573 [Polyplosphaeria fusca]
MSVANHHSGRASDADDLQREQRELYDVRDAALAARFKLQIQRTEVSNTRVKAGTSEGIFISRLREFLRSIDIALPDAVEKGFEEVLELRESLGNEESDYFEAEEKYNLLEWRYNKKERSLLARLGETKSKTRQVLERNQRLLETEEATRFAGGPLILPKTFPFNDPSISYDQSQVTSIRQAAQAHSSQLPATTQPKLIRKTQSAQDMHIPKPSPAAYHDASSTFYSDDADSRVFSAEGPKEDRISAWIPSPVNITPPHRRYLKEFFEGIREIYLKKERLSSLAMRYWSSGELDGPVVPTAFSISPISASILQASDSGASQILDGRSSALGVDNILSDEPEPMHRRMSINQSMRAIEQDPPSQGSVEPGQTSKVSSDHGGVVLSIATREREARTSSSTSEDLVATPKVVGTEQKSLDLQSDQVSMVDLELTEPDGPSERDHLLAGLGQHPTQSEVYSAYPQRLTDEILIPNSQETLSHQYIPEPPQVLINSSEHPFFNGINDNDIPETSMRRLSGDSKSSSVPTPIDFESRSLVGSANPSSCTSRASSPAELQRQNLHPGRL